jgi:hypothetical protein
MVTVVVLVPWAVLVMIPDLVLLMDLAQMILSAVVRLIQPGEIHLVESTDVCFVDTQYHPLAHGNFVVPHCRCKSPDSTASDQVVVALLLHLHVVVVGPVTGSCSQNSKLSSTGGIHRPKG